MNIIPVIAKADTVSKSELDKLKIKIMSELVSNGVQIYQFPTEDEAVTEINSSMNVSPRSHGNIYKPMTWTTSLSKSLHDDMKVFDIFLHDIICRIKA